MSLAVNAGPALQDAAGNGLTDTAPASSQSYTLDHVAPSQITSADWLFH